MKSRDGNAHIQYIVDTTDDNRFVFRSELKFETITTEYVGKYYCVYNNSIKDDSKTNFDPEVEKNKASSIYVFVDGERADG